MAGQTYASINKIESLDTELQHTVPMLEQVSDENTRMISSTLVRIDGVLGRIRDRERIAQDDLMRAEAALANAESMAYSSDEGSIDLTFLYRIDVDRCRRVCDEIAALRRQGEKIKGDYQSSVDHCLVREERAKNNYVAMLRQGSSLLQKYMELLRKSHSEIGNGGSSTSQQVGGTAQPGAATGLLGGLQATRQEWHADSNGNEFFNTPEETGAKLDSEQGKYSRTIPDGGRENYKGTCGLVSCVNVLRLAGIEATEQQIVKYAIDHGLCGTGEDPDSNGSSSFYDRQKILAAFGLNSQLIKQSNTMECITVIADNIASGRGVIVSVHAGMLYSGKAIPNDLHAITVTSVQKTNGVVTGFYVCDSNFPNAHGMQYYPVGQLMHALSLNKMNVTTSIIR